MRYPERLDLESILANEVEQGLVSARKHPDYPELTILNYTPATQYSRQWTDVTSMTRGVVVTPKGYVVAPCMPKMFNLGEYGGMYDIDDYMYGYEKLDGSMITVFYYAHRDKWIAASRGSFESDQAAWAQQLVDDVLVPGGYLEIGNVYVCELIHPQNRIVLDYGDEVSLRLLRVFKYVPNPVEASWYEQRVGLGGCKWPYDIAKLYSMDEIKYQLENLFVEGFILHGNDVPDVKIKTEDYVWAHRIVTSLTTKNVLEAWYKGEQDELLDTLPDEWYPDVSRLLTDAEQISYNETRMILQMFEGIRNIETRKDYAAAVMQDYRDWSAALFKLRDGATESDVLQMVREHIYRNYEDYGLEL